MTELPLVEPLAYSIRQCAAALSVSERQVYILAERDGLPTIKVGGRRLVRVADLRAWLAAQPAAVPAFIDRQRQATTTAAREGVAAP
ncbi:MAG: helix-turn-helix domain-containing protein [Phycisphaerae bacterium]